MRAAFLCVWRWVGRWIDACAQAGLGIYVVILLVAVPLFNAGALSKTIRNLVAYLMSVMVVLSLESAIFFSLERQSLTSLLLGKGAILTLRTSTIRT